MTHGSCHGRVVMLLKRFEHGCKHVYSTRTASGIISVAKTRLQLWVQPHTIALDVTGEFKHGRGCSKKLKVEALVYKPVCVMSCS